MNALADFIDAEGYIRRQYEWRKTDIRLVNTDLKLLEISRAVALRAGFAVSKIFLTREV